jgi:hypothetical protein
MQAVLIASAFNVRKVRRTAAAKAARRAFCLMVFLTTAGLPHG